MIPSFKRRYVPAKYLERRPVTVCIAATCMVEKKYKVVMCTDWKISSALGNADTKLKQKRMGAGWFLLTAGEDGEINAIERILSKKMLAQSASKLPLDDTTVPTLVRDALAERKKQKIDDHIRGQYGMTYEEMIDLGHTKLPSDIYREAMYFVRDLSIEADFIVAGFSSGYPLLIQTEGATKVNIKDLFAVAGEGGYLAQSVLLNRGHMDVNSLERTLYCVYEAKIYSEGATSVGKTTAIQILNDDGSVDYFNNKGLEALAEQYKSFGPRKIESPKKLDPEMLKHYPAKT